MATDTLKIGSTAPNFNLLGVDEKEYSLGSFSDMHLLRCFFRESGPLFFNSSGLVLNHSQS